MQTQTQRFNKLLGLALTVLLAFAVLFSSEASAATTRRANNTVPAFTDPALTNRNGNERVDRGDNVVVLQETNDACYVRYPTPNGTKDRWVSKCIFAKVVYPNEGDYFIIPESNGSHALNVKGGGQAARGTPIQLYGKNDTDAQIFTIKRVSDDWYKIIHKRTGQIINVQNGNQNNGARLWLWSEDGTDSCYWRFIDAGNGSYIIQSRLGQQKVFDLANNNPYSGATVQLWQYHTNQAARWKLVRFTPASYATLNDGWYKISPLHATGRLLDVNGASTAVGANVQLWDNNTSESQPNQVFYLKNLGNNWFTLKAGHCDLNVAAADTSGSVRTNIQLASPNAGSATQQWRLVYSSTSGAYYIESRIREKLAFDCADTGSANGTNIWLWDYGDVNWNKWRFTPTRPPSISPTPGGGLKGDVNGDGKIEQVDADLLLEHLRGRTNAINRSNSDMNNDGELSIADVQLILNKLREAPQPTPTPTRQAKRTVPAFTDSGLNNRIGNERVDAGDTVAVLNETSGAYFVRYPTSNGTKDRWVSKDIFVDPPPVTAQLQSLINRWEGKTWVNGTFSGWNEVTNPKVARECKEFAAYIFGQLYLEGKGYYNGGYIGGSETDYTIAIANKNKVACRGTKINITVSDVKELFQNAQPGDLVQMKRRYGDKNPHTAILVRKDNNEVTFFEANADGRNSIRTNPYSYNDLADKNYAMSIYYAK